MTQPPPPAQPKTPTIYKSWTQIIAAATAGRLVWMDFGNDKTGLLGYITSHPEVTEPEATTLLGILKTTQPKDTVMIQQLQLLVDNHSFGKPLSIPNPISGVTNFLNVLASKNLWIRVGEFLVGGILLAVGANAILKQSGVDVSKAIK